MLQQYTTNEGHLTSSPVLAVASCPLISPIGKEETMPIVAQSQIADVLCNNVFADALQGLNEALTARMALAQTYPPDCSIADGNAFAVMDAQVNQQIEMAAALLAEGVYELL
jgi:hypothetical protein